MIEIFQVVKHFNGYPVLNGINLCIQKGSVTAIIGESGCGKTVLLKSIIGLIKADSGEILIDGKNVSEYDLQGLRSSIGVVLQDVFLFSNSIFDNISFGQTSSLDEVISVAKEAQAHDFVSALPKKYDSEVPCLISLCGGVNILISYSTASSDISALAMNVVFPVLPSIEYFIFTSSP